MPHGVPDDPDARQALALLRSFSAGTLLVDDSPRPVRYIVEPRQGRIILPMEPRDLDAAEWILCLPEDSYETRARVSLDPEPLGEHDEAVDRFCAYHGHLSGSGLWARAGVAFVKLDHGPVVDGDDLMLPNPLLGEQTALCRALNADPDRLREACLRTRGVSPEDPMGVGVDPLGLDVRARFGVLRIEFAVEAHDAVSARARIADWLGGSTP